MATTSALSLAVTGGILLDRVDARYLVAAGLVLSAMGPLFLAHVPLDVDAWGLIWPSLTTGTGMGLFFVPLTPIAFDAVPSGSLDEASGLYALMRGIALVSWLLVRQGQVHWQTLIGYITPFSPALLPYQSALDLHGEGTLMVMAGEIRRQSEMQAFDDLFWLIGWINLAILPLLLLGRRPLRRALVMA